MRYRWADVSVELSEATVVRANALFEADEADAAAALLRDDCADGIHFPVSTPEGLERVRFAALKLSRDRFQALGGRSISHAPIGATSSFVHALRKT